MVLHADAHAAWLPRRLSAVVNIVAAGGGRERAGWGVALTLAGPGGMYSFGVFFEEIRGLQLEARQLAVVFRLADYPSLVVRPDPGARILADVTPAGTVPIRAGKSCLFHCPPAVPPPRTLQLLLVDLLQPLSAADESQPSPASLVGKGLLLARASIELEPCLATQWYSPAKVKMVDLAGNLIATLVGHTRLARQDTALTPHLLSVGMPAGFDERPASAARVPAPLASLAAGSSSFGHPDRQPPVMAHATALPVETGANALMVPGPPAADVTGAAVHALTALAAALPAIVAGGAAAYTQAAPAPKERESHASVCASAAMAPYATLSASLPPDPRSTSDAAVQSDVHGDVYSSVRGDMYRYAEESWRPLPSDTQLSEGAPGAKVSLRSAKGAAPLWAREPPPVVQAEAILIDGAEDQGATPPAGGYEDEYVHPRLRSVRAPPGLYFHHDPAALAAAEASEAARTAAHLTAAAVASAAGGGCCSASSVGCAHSAAAPPGAARPPPEAWGAGAAAAAAVQVAAAAVEAAAVSAVADADAVRRRWRLDPATAAARIAATLPQSEVSGARTPAWCEPSGGILSGLGGAGGAGGSGAQGSVLQGLVSDLEYVQSPQYAMEMVRASLLRKGGAQQHAPPVGRAGAAAEGDAPYTAGGGGGAAASSRTADAVELLSATVPPGVGPGDYIRLVTPAGRTVEVPVPPHAATGDMFHFVAEAEAGAPPPGGGEYDASSATARRFATAGEAAASAARQLLASVRRSVGGSTFGDTATGWTEPASRSSVRDSRPLWGVGPGGRSRPRPVGRASRAAEPMLSDASLLGLWGGPAAPDAGATRYAHPARPVGGCTFAAGGIGGFGSTVESAARRSHVLAGGAACVHQDSVANASQLARGPSADACIASIEAERRSLLEEMRHVRASLRVPGLSDRTAMARPASPGSRYATGCAVTSPVTQRSGRSPASARGTAAGASSSAATLPSSQLWPAERASERRLVAILQASFQKLDPTGRGCVPIGRLIRALEAAGATDAASTPDARAWSTRLRSLCLRLEARLHAAASAPGGDDMEFLIFWEDALALAAGQKAASEAGGASGLTARSAEGGALTRAADAAQAAADDAGYTPPTAISQAAARFVAANALQMPERGARIECTGGGLPASLMAAAAAEHAAAATGARVSRAMRQSGAGDATASGGCWRAGDTTHLVVPLETDSGPGGVAIPAEMVVPGNIRALSRTQYLPQGVPRLLPTVVGTTDAAGRRPPHSGEALTDVSTAPQAAAPAMTSCAPSGPSSRAHVLKPADEIGRPGVDVVGVPHAIESSTTAPPDTSPLPETAIQGGSARVDGGELARTSVEAVQAGPDVAQAAQMVAPDAEALVATPGAGAGALRTRALDAAAETAGASVATPGSTLPKPRQISVPSVSAEASPTIRSQPATSGTTAADLHAVVAAPCAAARTVAASAAVERVRPVSWAAPSATLSLLSDLGSPILELSRSQSLLDSGYLSHSLLDSGCLGHGGDSGSLTPYSLSESGDSQPGEGHRRASSPTPGALDSRWIAGGACSGDAPSASCARTPASSSAREAPATKASTAMAPTASATQKAVAHATLSPSREAVENASTLAVPRSTSLVTAVKATTPGFNAATLLPATSITARPAAAIAARVTAVAAAGGAAVGVVKVAATKPMVATATAVRIVKKEDRNDPS